MMTFKSLAATLAVVSTTATMLPSLATANSTDLGSPQTTDLAQTMTSPTGTGRSCVALQEVTTGQTEIRRRIENRAILGNNWHTDWLVPNQPNFTYFVAMVTPENTAPYWLDVHLRMSHGGSEKVFSDRADAEAGSTFIIPFGSPTGRQPALVNTRLGGLNGNFYTISVAACE